jgi:integrase
MHLHLGSSKTHISQKEPGTVAIVRKRTRTHADGTVKVTWQVDFKDASGVRRHETHRLKKQADARLADILNGLKLGTFTPNSTSKTVKEACELWYQRCVTLKRERATLANYRRFLDAHILPLLGRTKLSALTTPGVENFCDELLQRVPPITAQKILTAFKGVLKEAKRRGLVAQNVALDSKIEIPARDQDPDDDSHGPLRAGYNMPDKDEVRRMIDAAAASPERRWRPLVITLAFAGMRASEARGLRWDDVDLVQGTITVRRRADRYNAIGAPKSTAGKRTIPLGATVTNVLREWKLRCPKGKSELVFPSQADTPLLLSNIVNLWFRPMQKKAGIVDRAGNPKYRLHSLRHFCASYWIDLGYQPKKIMTMMGHASIVMTFNVYGALFPDPEADNEKLNKGELSILG